jgi:hypothetical protein
MKKFLLATALLAGLMTSAQAQAIPDWEVRLPIPRPDPTATIPAEYRGEWCAHGVYSLRRSIERCERGGEQWLEVTAKTFSAWEEECRILKVRPDPNKLEQIPFDFTHSLRA